jgi:hypothetical protein
MMILKGFGRKQPWPDFEVLFQYLPGGTEENYKNVKSAKLTSGARFKAWTSQIRSRSVKNSTTWHKEG